MKFKLDENPGVRCVELLRSAGHDVATVAGQGMTSAEDRDVIRACGREQRALVTLDLDFSNPLIFPPHEYAGVVVLRLPRKPSHVHLIACIRTFLGGLEREVLTGKLWTVEIGRLRIYQPPEE